MVQSAVADKMRREVARLAGELDRLEKEVARQKTLRYGLTCNHCGCLSCLCLPWLLPLHLAYILYMVPVSGPPFGVHKMYRKTWQAPESQNKALSFFHHSSP